ncbi:MAG: SAM-dependent methyltransferase, partial [Kangiellaceae bacterium]|nr:SAM-dependent methyltransferase [Kangiellaceae bacterium]
MTKHLTVVGTGLITPQHMTLETQRYITAADVVLHIVPDPLGVDFLKTLNDNLIYLGDCYKLTDNRRDTYSMMVERIMAKLEQYDSVVAVFYGHPAVFVTPTHEVIELAKAKGYQAKMLPGISAEDCLFADLGVDPSTFGLQTCEATYFLVYDMPLDKHSAVIVWQLGVVGDLTFNSQDIKPSENGLQHLADKLMKYYPGEHQVVVYEAATLPMFKARMDWIKLSQLASLEVTERSTLFIPAIGGRPKDSNYLSRLTQKE